MQPQDIGRGQAFLYPARMLDRISFVKFCYCAAAALIGAMLGATAPGSWRAAEVAAHVKAPVAEPVVRRGE